MLASQGDPTFDPLKACQRAHQDILTATQQPLVGLMNSERSHSNHFANGQSFRNRRNSGAHTRTGGPVVSNTLEGDQTTHKALGSMQKRRATAGAAIEASTKQTRVSHSNTNQQHHVHLIEAIHNLQSSQRQSTAIPKDKASERQRMSQEDLAQQLITTAFAHKTQGSLPSGSHLFGHSSRGQADDPSGLYSTQQSYLQTATQDDLTRLLSQSHRKKPFQIKQASQLNQHKYQSNQPIMPKQTHEDRLRTHTGQRNNNQQESIDSIQVQGVKKGLQPQIGRQAPQSSLEGQPRSSIPVERVPDQDLFSRYRQQLDNEFMAPNPLIQTHDDSAEKHRGSGPRLEHDPSQSSDNNPLSLLNQNQLHQLLIQHQRQSEFMFAEGQTLSIGNGLSGRASIPCQTRDGKSPQLVDPDSYLTVSKTSGGARPLLGRQDTADKKSASAQRYPSHANTKKDLLSQFVKSQLDNHCKVQAPPPPAQKTGANQPRPKAQAMQVELDKMRTLSDPQQYRRKGNVVRVNHGGRANGQIGAMLSPINKNHLLRSSNPGFNLYTMQKHPMSIQTCHQSREGSLVCEQCHGLVINSDQKRAQMKENFLLCSCPSMQAAISLQQLNDEHQQMIANRAMQGFGPALNSYNQALATATATDSKNTRMMLVGGGQGESGVVQDSQFVSMADLEQPPQNAFASTVNSLTTQHFNKLTEMQIEVLNRRPYDPQAITFKAGPGSASKPGQVGIQPDLADIKTFIKKQVDKFYQNNLVHNQHETATQMQQMGGIECKGQTIGGIVLTKPLGYTIQDARRLAYEKDRRVGSVGAHNFQGPLNLQEDAWMGALASQYAFQEKKLKHKAKSSNTLGGGTASRNGPKRASSTVADGKGGKQGEQNVRMTITCDINSFFTKINEFVRVTLKFKETITQSHLAQIRKLGRNIGLKFGSVRELDAKFINSKDFVAILKSKIFCMLNAIVMQASVPLTDPLAHSSHKAPSALQNPNTTSSQKVFKFYVEPSGNNHTVVRSVIKRRSWYSSQELSQEHGWSGPGPKLLNLIWTQVRRPRVLRELQHYQIYNHIDGINEVAQKSTLFVNMQKYYAAKGQNVFDYLPETYLVPAVASFEVHPSFKAFKAAYQPDQLWIFKPGESSNRGNGIKVFKDFEKIRAHMQEVCRGQFEGGVGKRAMTSGGKYRSYVLQRYITRPLLINKRKFDIRVFALLVCHADTGKLRGYFYDEGYLRTSSKDFNLDKWDNRLIHLTNDAIQKNSADYGKYESANKISYHDYEKHLTRERGVSFLQTIVPRIREAVTDVFEATGRQIYRPKMTSEGVSRTESAPNYNAFELMGLDFMLDADLNLTLIEVNTNPCLDTPCMLLQRMIPQVLDQTLKLAVDPFLQATEHQYYMTQDLNVAEMRFQLVYQDSMALARKQQSEEVKQAATFERPLEVKGLNQLSTDKAPSGLATVDGPVAKTVDNKEDIDTLSSIEAKSRHNQQRSVCLGPAPSLLPQFQTQGGDAPASKGVGGKHSMTQSVTMPDLIKTAPKIVHQQADAKRTASIVPLSVEKIIPTATPSLNCVGQGD